MSKAQPVGNPDAPSPRSGPAGGSSGPSRKAIIGWGVAMLVVLALAWLVGAVVVPYVKVREIATRHEIIMRGPGIEEQLAELGGPDEARYSLSLYVRLSDAIAPGRSVAVHLLAHCGEPAYPTLDRALDDPNAMVRAMAAQGIARMGPVAKPSVPSLVRLACEDQQVDVRRACAETVATLAGPGEGQFVPALIRALQDADGFVRRDSAKALGRIGKTSSPAVPALLEMTQSEVTEDRDAAIEALGRIGPLARAAVPRLRALLNHSDWATRESARQALRRIEDEGDAPLMPTPRRRPQ